MMPQTRIYLKTVMMCAIPLALSACQSDVPAEVDEGLEEGCEHMTEGPAQPISASLEGAGPDVSTSHTRFDVALATQEAGNGGFVSYASGEAGDYRFYLSVDVPVSVKDALGAPVAIESSASGGDCTVIALYHTIELGVGTYTLSFGPTTETSVSLVAELSGEHAHEE